MNVIYLGPENALSAAQSVLEPYWTVSFPSLTSEAVAAHLSETVAILDASMRIRLDRRMLDGAPHLRVISTATTGADHIDSTALAERRIPLLTLRDETELLSKLTPAAELSWLLLMACARHLTEAVQHVLEGNWRREEFPGIMLKGKTLGLIGCGRIGSWMARYARAFDMVVIGYDPFLSEWPELIAKCHLDTVLSTADFISIHVPFNDETCGIIGAQEFSVMKQGAVFINTSRGGVADEKALLQALLSGRLSAAGLDVLQGEPLINDHPLVAYARHHDNLIITPHIGGFSPDAVRAAVQHAAKRIANFLRSDTLVKN